MRGVFTAPPAMCYQAWGFCSLKHFKLFPNPFCTYSDVHFVGKLRSDLCSFGAIGSGHQTYLSVLTAQARIWVSVGAPHPHA